MRCLESSSNTTENIMMPMPPSWIRLKMTICPVRVKVVPVSTTVSPVTQTADVAVKRASMNARLPPVVLWGSIKTIEPARIAPAKLRIRRSVDLRKRRIQTLEA